MKFVDHKQLATAFLDSDSDQTEMTEQFKQLIESNTMRNGTHFCIMHNVQGINNLVDKYQNREQVTNSEMLELMQNYWGIQQLQCFCEAYEAGADERDPKHYQQVYIYQYAKNIVTMHAELVELDKANPEELYPIKLNDLKTGNDNYPHTPLPALSDDADFPPSIDDDQIDPWVHDQEVTAMVLTKLAAGFKVAESTAPNRTHMGGGVGVGAHNREEAMIRSSNLGPALLLAGVTHAGGFKQQPRERGHFSGWSERPDFMMPLCTTTPEGMRYNFTCQLINGDFTKQTYAEINPDTHAAAIAAMKDGKLSMLHFDAPIVPMQRRWQMTAKEKQKVYYGVVVPMIQSLIKQEVQAVCITDIGCGAFNNDPKFLTECLIYVLDCLHYRRAFSGGFNMCIQNNQTLPRAQETIREANKDLAAFQEKFERTLTANFVDQNRQAAANTTKINTAATAVAARTNPENSLPNNSAAANTAETNAADTTSIGNLNSMRITRTAINATSGGFAGAGAVGLAVLVPMTIKAGISTEVGIPAVAASAAVLVIAILVMAISTAIINSKLQSQQSALGDALTGTLRADGSNNNVTSTP